MKQNKQIIDYRFLYLFIPLIYIDFTFHTIGFGVKDFFSYMRDALFVLVFSILVTFITSRFKSRKVMFYVNLIIVIFFSCYGFAELEFKRFIDTYYSFNSVSEMGVRISQYVGYFISDALPSFYLCLLGIPFYLVLYFNVHYSDGAISPSIVAGIIALITLILTFNVGSTSLSISDTYLSFNNSEYLINKVGLSHFFFRDITALKFRKEDEIEIIVEEPIIEEVIEEEVIEEVKHRIIDDTRWLQLQEEETNSSLQKLDNYFYSKSVTDYNDRTGIFEGYNYINILVESFDYLAIDKDLTPTLYMMYKDGISFSNHYTPKYSCATGDSEFISLTSLVPLNYTCTSNEVANDNFPEALPNLFKNKGYTTYSFHNWTDQFYDRHALSSKLGIDLYMDYNDIGFKTVVGWQSDTEMVEKTYDKFSKDDKFFVHYVTSVMHWPYDSSSYFGDLDVKTIREYHPDWEIDYCRYMSKCMEYDRSLAKLIELLKKDNLLDKTIIAMYPDHRPHKLSEPRIIELTKNIKDRTINVDGIDITPFIIYNPNIESEINDTVCSTFDQVPTIANMFNLNYDPRLYIGSDIYSNTSRFVFFPNGDFITEKGCYDLSLDKFNGEGLTSEEIRDLETKVQNVYKISRLAMETNYFEKRKIITSPDA